MKNSKIGWTDHTFNPWIGCQKVSPGCDHCYAEELSPNLGDAKGQAAAA
jgi:protein gp37